LFWECVALQHQLSVLRRSGTRRPRFRSALLGVYVVVVVGFNGAQLAGRVFCAFNSAPQYRVLDPNYPIPKLQSLRIGSPPQTSLLVLYLQLRFRNPV
jgi:hypothetical protein